MRSFMPPLPVDAQLPELLAALSASTRCVLEAPPGAGKTTRVPLALLEAEWLAGRSIVMLEPRRMAARNAARYMASLLGEDVGRTVGYRVRLDSRVGPATRIVVVTEGILTRMLQDDPELSGVGCLIFDEFHERSLHADLGLALALDCQEGLRETLRILVMSATLDAASILALLERNFSGPVPSLRSEGRAWPVETRYLPPARADRPLERDVAEAVRRALREETGSVLVFLPGVGEIRKVEALLQDIRSDTVRLCPLYGDLSLAEQDAAIAPLPSPLRKVVLATSIAETSLTIEGVRVVVDAGLSRTLRFDAGSGMSRLVTGRVSLAAAAQRRGRAGRTEAGVCYRLWHEGEEPGMAAHARPEILEADMAPLCLELAVWGVAHPSALRWLDEPPEEGVRQALALLRGLGAVDGAGRATPRGRAMARLPLHPRLAHMLLEGAALGMGRTACLLAALAEERDPLAVPEVDVRSRLALLEGGGGGSLAARIREAARQFARLLSLKGKASEVPSFDEAERAGALLALAYPDRVAQRRERGSFRLAQGRGAFLDPHDPLADELFLAVGGLNAASGNARIWQAAPLSRETLEALYGSRFETRSDVFWDERQEAGAASRRTYYGALVLEERPLREGGGDLAGQRASAVLDGIRRLGLSCLPWTEELEQWRLRVRLLASLEPEAWPDLSDAVLLADLESWLAPFLEGISRRSHFSRIDLGAALRSLVPWDKLRRVEREVPAALEVPSGSHVRLRYEASPEGAVPVLAVKLQELFGMVKTPAVAGGRVPVLVHLLSPAGRPLQITRDLEHFWRHGYPLVRAEMRGRYPKHPWPEDPFTAMPTRHTNRRLRASAP
ncbi:ATP-dependent helicase HrpB [uncultured Bilophila sp.]|nr:ATP-dependent helicase HrpB [uncultured Bilophila sp.]